ncbi:biotin/lipoyl-containing protein [Planktotalea arctica]|uniref:biotin/lipoyl-containing protein n=1 Tax=Planktotalea arctica TaxID=1481893 RepID=UPI000A174802|nr:biotin/lipoyl-containing protein [Planktotalea arctica]
MANHDITPIVMPKLGMTMTEGKVVDWQIKVGDEVTEGDEVVGIETEKITNACESPADGVFRRRIADDGGTLLVGGLIGIIAQAETSDADIDSFIANFKPEEQA